MMQETYSALKSALVALDKLDTDLVKKYEDINVDGFSAFATEDFKIDSVLDDQLVIGRDAIGKAYAMKEINVQTFRISSMK